MQHFIPFLYWLNFFHALWRSSCFELDIIFWLTSAFQNLFCSNKLSWITLATSVTIITPRITESTQQVTPITSNNTALWKIQIPSYDTLKNNTWKDLKTIICSVDIVHLVAHYRASFPLYSSTFLSIVQPTRASPPDQWEDPTAHRPCPCAQVSTHYWADNTN